jgi:hypothetical protein
MAVARPEKRIREEDRTRRKDGLGGVTEKRMVSVRFLPFRPSQREAGPHLEIE